MDFTLSEDLLSVQGLARDIFTDRAPVDRVVAVEATDSRVDDDLWAALVDAGLTTLHLPEAAGGDDMGLSGLVVSLIEQGRVVAPVPLWSAAISAYAVAHLGTSEQVGRVLSVRGGGPAARCTAALEEFSADPHSPRCAAVEDSDHWVLTGEKAAVPTPAGTAYVIVSAMTMDGPGLFLVRTEGSGVRWERAETTSRDWAGNLSLEQAPAERLGDEAALGWILQASSLALAALQVGIGEGALALTADYLKGREQFGRSLGSFQAVQHQLADCWIALDAMRVTLWHAVAAFEEGAPDAARLVDVARYWAGQGGADLVHRTQHLHGGIGVDVDYPIHRYYLWGKQTANTLGGPQAALASLGEFIAREEIRS